MWRGCSYFGIDQPCLLVKFSLISQLFELHFEGGGDRGTLHKLGLASSRPHLCLPELGPQKFNLTLVLLRRNRHHLLRKAYGTAGRGGSDEGHSSDRTSPHGAER